MEIGSLLFSFRRLSSFSGVKKTFIHLAQAVPPGDKLPPARCFRFFFFRSFRAPHNARAFLLFKLAILLRDTIPRCTFLCSYMACIENLHRVNLDRIPSWNRHRDNACNQLVFFFSLSSIVLNCAFSMSRDRISINRADSKEFGQFHAEFRLRRDDGVKQSTL